MDTTTTDGPRLVDESGGNLRSRYFLERVYRYGLDTIRVCVNRDPYDFPSSAVVEILNAERRWTVLATAPASDWHDATRTCAPSAIPAHLATVADRLITRAVTILR
jgi:hypothetical protein